MIKRNDSLKTIIVDDELDAVEVLIDLIQENCQNLQIVGSAHSVKDGIKLIEESKPDLLFLDIQMPGKTGFDLLRQTTNQKFQTIFVSAHESYAIEAIRFHAMAYLLKPIVIEELIDAINMVNEEVINQTLTNYEALLSNLGPTQQKRIAIPTGKGYRYFQPKEIIRVEAAKNYSNVFTTESKKPILVSKNLKQFEILLDKYGFLRIHHAHLINPNHIREYARQDGGSVILTDNLDILVGQSYRSVLIEYLNNSSDGI